MFAFERTATGPTQNTRRRDSAEADEPSAIIQEAAPIPGSIGIGARERLPESQG
jgi:hypothetical protein